MPILRNPYNVGEPWKIDYKLLYRGVGLFMNIILPIVLLIAIFVLRRKGLI